MAYSQVERDLWDHDGLEGLAFEAKAFFVYLFTNPRIRPSGIYRVTDDQLAADIPLPLATVRLYLEELQTRGRIVRDGAWIFVRGYLTRQGKNGYLLAGAHKDVHNCPSQPIIDSFIAKYPLYSKWVTMPRPSLGASLEHGTLLNRSKEKLSKEKRSNGMPDPCHDNPPEIAIALSPDEQRLRVKQLVAGLAASLTPPPDSPAQ